MKTVYFVRHAKSSWDNANLRDHDRPLNSRGLRDAPFMAKLLKGKGVKADLIISSSANRALTTAKYFAAELGVKEKEIQVEKSIYEAYGEDVLRILKNVDKSMDTVFVFGHNPTFTSIVNRFTEDYIANLPTCGVVKVELDIKKWKDLDEKLTLGTSVYFPKQYF